MKRNCGRLITSGGGLYCNGILIHSAKGSTWKHHKYIKKKDGRYYYNEDGPDKPEVTNTWTITAGNNVVKRIETSNMSPAYGRDLYRLENMDYGRKASTMASRFSSDVKRYASSVGSMVSKKAEDLYKKGKSLLSKLFI